MSAPGEPHVVRPRPVGGDRVQCPDCGASYPSGPAVCPICAGLGAPSTGSSGPGEDRVLEVELDDPE